MLDVNANNEEAVDVDTDNQFGTSESKSKNFKPFDKANYFNFKSGVNVYRIMPAMFSNLESGHWAVYYGRHFGYVDSEGKMKSFTCIKKYDEETRALVEECPFCVDQETKKARKESLDHEVKELHAQINKHQSVGTHPDQIAALQRELKDKSSELSVASKLYNARQKRFWVNAMNMNGEFGLLGLPQTVYEGLAGKREQDKKTNKYIRKPGLLAKLKEDKKVDALDVNQGVWFSIEKTGSTQYDTEYKIEPFKEEKVFDDGSVGEIIKRAPLSTEQKKLALTKCKDLNHVFDYLFLTAEQAKQVINGSPAAVNAVMNAPRKVEQQTVVGNGNVVAGGDVLNRQPPEWLTDKELLAKFNNQPK